MINVFSSVLNVEEIIKELKLVLQSGWIGLGPKTKQFEQEIAKFLGVKYFCALNSCTSALHLAFKCLNLPKGSRVLTTPITFVSTNHAILYEDLEPVFCDVEKLTGNIDTTLIEYAIKKYNIKALIVVHLGGYSVNMDTVNEIAKKYNLPVIEDCAHAFGAKYKDKKIGNTDNLCVWSFHAVKNLSISDGGGISTNNEELYKRFNKLRWLGIDKDTASRSLKEHYICQYNVEELGYKYHLNDILSTIGLVGLRSIENANKRRKYIAEYYLKNIKGLIKPNYDDFRESSYHFIPLFFKNRDEIYNELINNNICPSIHYKRNDQYQMYQKFIKINNCNNAEWYEKHEITLPIHLGLTEQNLEYIVKTINNFLYGVQ